PNKKPYISRATHTCCDYCTNVKIGLQKIKGFYVQCSYCDKPYWTSPCLAGITNYCSRKCQNLGYEIFDKYNRKNEDEKWAQKYYGPNWRKQRRKARERDGFCCQMCRINETEYGMELSIHHITPFVYFDNYKKANNLSNLKSLCEPCHRKIHSGESHPAYFSKDKIIAKNENGKRFIEFKENAIKVVDLLFNSDLPLNQIGKEVGVSHTTVVNIYNGKSWKELYEVPCCKVKPRYKYNGKSKSMVQSSPTG
ncbi:MAG: HNH endonuclease, partial [Bacillota bacterium]